MDHEFVLDEHGRYYHQDPTTNLYVEAEPVLLSTMNGSSDKNLLSEPDEEAGPDVASHHQDDNSNIRKTQWTVSSVGDLTDNNRIMEVDEHSEVSAPHDPETAAVAEAQRPPPCDQAFLKSYRIYPTAESIPPIQKTGNPFEHHADGGQAWMDKAFEEGIRDPEIIDFDGDCSNASRCNTPAEMTPTDDEGSNSPPAKKHKKHDSRSPVEKVALSKAQRDHKALHDKAKSFRPSHSFKDGRFWIGVVKLDLAPNKVKEKGDVFWFKGNKNTCVKTVWHKFKEHDVSLINFRLQLRDEFPEPFDVMEELDFYADKQIVFRSCTFVDLDD